MRRHVDFSFDWLSAASTEHAVRSKASVNQLLKSFLKPFVKVLEGGRASREHDAGVQLSTDVDRTALDGGVNHHI
jgi:hypothetical protein